MESLNSVIRRVIKKRNVFPTDDLVFKVIWLAMKDGCIKEMDNVDSKLETGDESIYD